MHLIGVSILIQILCAVHCVRNGRNGMWLTVIIFLSVPGCLAYAFFEVLPGLSGRREVRAAKSAAIRKLDPQRDVRAARDALELAETAANRIALGDALFESGAFAQASLHYREALTRTAAEDRPTQLKLARAELEGGNAREALALLEALPPSGSPARTTARPSCSPARPRKRATPSARYPFTRTSESASPAAKFCAGVPLCFSRMGGAATPKRCSSRWSGWQSGSAALSALSMAICTPGPSGRSGT
jgi:hypothetical protein